MKKLLIFTLFCFLFFPIKTFALVDYTDRIGGQNKCCDTDPTTCIGAIAETPGEPDYLIDFNECVDKAHCQDGFCFNHPCANNSDCASNFCDIHNGARCGEIQAPAEVTPGTGATPGAEKDVTKLAPAVSYEIPNFLGVKDPNTLIGRLIKVLIGLSGTLALLVFIYGGFRWLISRGVPAEVQKGTTAMKYASLGLALIFSSYLIVNFLLDLAGA